MSNFVKQSTAVVISYGPFLDKTDGVTEETGLVSALDHATTGIKLSKNGGALTIRHATVTATTYDAYGMYRVTLDTTDTNTLGTLRMAFNEAATCLPVWQDFMVLPANIFDSIVSGSDALDVSAIQFAGQTITASGGVTIPAATLASTTNITAGTIATVTTVTNQLTAAQIATGVWQDATAGDFTTASSIGKALYVANVAPGGAGGHFIAGTNAATAITTALTANITGNLSGSVGSVTTVSDKTGYSLTATTGLGNQTSNITGTITTATNLTNLPATAALEATLTAMKGATFAGATDSLEAIRDRGDAAWATATGFATPTNITAGTITTVTNLTNAPTAGDLTATMKTSVTTAATAATPTAAAVTGAVGSVTAAVTLPTIPTNWITADGIATDAFGALELATDAAAEIAAAISIPSAAAVASQVRTELTTELARIDVATSTRLATAGYTAPLDAAGTRTAVGLATANLDTQLGDLPTATENAARVLDTETLDTGLTVRHGLELAAGSVLNKLSGGGTGTEVVRNFSDTADLATVTVDGSGNKTAITYDFSI